VVWANVGVEDGKNNTILANAKAIAEIRLVIFVLSKMFTAASLILLEVMCKERLAIF
jgi:hypothetical protein